MNNSFFTPDELIPIKKRRETTIALHREKVPFVEFTDNELYYAKGGVLVLDEEVYPNYFLIAFRCYYTNRVVYFEKYEDVTLNMPKLLWVMHNFVTSGFNTWNFDIPLLWLAMTGASNETLKNVTDFIINGNWRTSDIEKAYNFTCGTVNHIDLIEVAPGQASLKAYGARLSAKSLQDLPYDPSTALTAEQREIVKYYCINDLILTAMLLKELSPQLELRAQLSLEYQQDLRSKSDAQIAEAVIVAEVKRKTGRLPQRPKIEAGKVYKYSLPDHIRFQDPELNKMLFEVAGADFIISEKGFIISPPELDKRDVTINEMTYRLGIGGIHSTEKSICHVADENTLLVDRDVESYYPRLILNQNLFPEQMGEPFLEIFDVLVESRLEDKRRASTIKKEIEDNPESTLLVELEKVTTGMNSKKITINGTYGKLSDKWSRIRSPGNMVQVTLTGQLSILMLIEIAELSGIPAISANTDGVVFKCPVTKYYELNQIITYWEKITNFKTEETRYKALYSKDVNNYLAIKPNNKVKSKGIYGEVDLRKNPTNYISVDAAMKLIVEGTPIEETIRNCKDLTKFLTVRQVKGGAEKDGVYLGKVVRWYMAKNQIGTINYIMSGNTVAKSENCKPCMDIPEEFPDDINYDAYIQEAVESLYDLGYYKSEKQIKFF